MTICCNLFLVLTVCTAQNSMVVWSASDVGFASSTSSITAIKSCVGQTLIGNSTIANTSVLSGFLVDTLFRGTILSIRGYDELPLAFALSQNYPNPFNPNTTISFAIPSRSFVSLKIFDLLGRGVTTIVSEEMMAGSYSKQWNAAKMSSGIYFYRLQAGSFSETKKLILLR